VPSSLAGLGAIPRRAEAENRHRCGRWRLDRACRDPRTL
ncbi:MAG: hypothetical protein AVDCRST_MAG38-21, partial [uncultured Solirubrobacteraceae bacterium]